MVSIETRINSASILYCDCASNHKTQNFRHVVRFPPKLNTIKEGNLPVLNFVVVYNHMFPYLNSLQHGFRYKRSWVTQMIQYVHFLSSTLESGGQVDTIYLDMAKAFDRVPHQNLHF